MKANHDKIDESTLALLFLTSHETSEYGGCRAWKSFDWDTMNRLYEKGFITDPKGKAKSVCLTPEGMEMSEKLFKKNFCDEGDSES